MCNETGSAVNFVLASHYYQRIWFFPLLAVLIGMSIWLAYQLRIRRLREHFNLILTERNRIARELHDTLIQGLSGITMEMQALAARMNSPDERGTLEDIIQDAGTCLRETRRSVAGLRSGNAGLAAAIEQAARQITETKHIRLKLNLQNKPTGLAPGRRIQPGPHRPGSGDQFGETFRRPDRRSGARLHSKALHFS